MPLDHKTLDRILDPRTTNLGSVGVALVKAAQRQRDCENIARHLRSHGLTDVVVRPGYIHGER